MKWSSNYSFKYLWIFSITIIKSKYCLLALSLGATIILPVLLVTCNNVNAQTLESITRFTNLAREGPQISVGTFPYDIKINELTNKIYVANSLSNTVSVIDSNSGTVKSIHVLLNPALIKINLISSKVYVANAKSNSISVIDGVDDSKMKVIPVGKDPEGGIAGTEMPTNVENMFPSRIFVANSRSHSVSVIDGDNDSKITDITSSGFSSPSGMAYNPSTNMIYVVNDGNNTVSVINATSEKRAHPDIPVGRSPLDIVVGGNMIYVANYDSNTVSVINGSTNTKKPDIPVDRQPYRMAYHPSTNMIYVVNYGNNTVSVINATSEKRAHPDIPTPPGRSRDIVVGSNKIYVANEDNDTVSVINGSTNTKKPDIPVGRFPYRMAYNPSTNMIYVANKGSMRHPVGSVSVIDGFSDKVAAGVIFKVNPANSGKVICAAMNHTAAYPIDTYVYVDAGTNCIAQPNKNFEFSSWVENRNHNSTLPLNQSAISDSPWNSFLSTLGMKPNDPSAAFHVNRFGTFTANFKQPHPVSSQELFTYLTGAISAAVAINGALLLLPAWRRTRKQRTHLKECLEMIDGDVGKSDKTAIEKKITEYYIGGNLSEDHRQLLKDKISEYYDSIKGSERYGAPFP